MRKADSPDSAFFEFAEMRVFMFGQDTVAAIVTSSKNGSISIIRVSGERAISSVGRIFCNERNESIDLKNQPTHTIRYGFICEGEKRIDEVLVLIMRAPRSYTAEDVVEIHCHGGHYICQVILDLLVRQGVRMAEPGEFTKRAFLNGRLDLSQAEAVMDVIQSKSRMALDNSLHQLKGSVREKVESLRNILLENIAYLEAALDDPEHISLDDFSANIENHVSLLLKETDHLISNSDNGRLIKEGIRTVIIGKPNVGKSSFLNCILRENRAIVTDEPGTTRDTLEEDVVIGSTLLHLIDTAGIHKTDHKIEMIGIEKTKQSLEQADFVIAIVDASESLTAEDQEIFRMTGGYPGVVLLNKTDLLTKVTAEDISNYSDKEVIPFSAVTGEGLQQLEEYLKRQVLEEKLETTQELYITNARQKEALCQTKESLLKVMESIELGMPEDLYSIDLTNAYEALGKIIGETVEEDIIEKIFKDFCMGK